MQRPISIDWISPRLGSWLSTLLGDAAVTFGPPSPDGGPSGAAARASRGINLHLLSIAPAPEAPLRGERRIELQIALRYLATSWAEERDAADLLLCTLVFHLLSPGVRGPDQQGEIALETAPPPQEVLSALGLPPRPAVVLQVPLFHVEEPPFAPRVTEAPIVRTGIAEGLRGRLVGPDEMAISGAQVEFPALGLLEQTDPDGQFRFGRIPADPAGQTIRVRARGVERTFRLSTVTPDRSVTLRMTFTEEQ